MLVPLVVGSTRDLPLPAPHQQPSPEARSGFGGSWGSLSFDSTASSRLEEPTGTTRPLILLTLRSLRYPRKQRQLKWTQLGLSWTVYLQSTKLPHVERYLIKF